MTPYTLNFADVSKYEKIINQIKALIMINGMIHASSHSNRKQTNYVRLKLFFVNHSPKMVLLWQRDQI